MYRKKINLDDADRQEAANMYKRGRTVAEIVTKYRISTHHLYEILDSFNIPRKLKFLAEDNSIYDDVKRKKIPDIEHLPVADSSFIKPITKAQLMARR